MPSFSDSIFIFVLALMLFGPKKLPQLARQLGKLMAEFRRASNEFRMQMEDELRIEEQKEHQQKVAAAAVPAALDLVTEDPPHPHLPLPSSTDEIALAERPERTAIAESGELKMMAPATGLPISRREGSAAMATQAEPMASQAELPAVPEHSILAPPAAESSAGVSSEEPAEVAQAVPESAAIREAAGEPVHHG